MRIEELRRRISRLETYRLLKMLTMHNRIQATRGIVEAAEDLEASLLEMLPDNAEVELINYSSKGVPGWMPTPRGWHLEEARVRIGGREITSSSHPTLAAPHTPPTDGWIRGEAHLIGDPLDPEEYRGVEGKVLVVKSHYRVAYRLAEEAGASGILFYREDLPPAAVPYIGLFLPDGEDHWLPAASIPRGMVEGIEGSSVELYIDADTGVEPRFPVIVSWIGDRRSEGPLLSAHYCHPEPGANDNASGVAAAIAAFKALAEADPGFTLRLALFPEYTGSAAVAGNWLADVTSAMVNLDMVGGRREPGLGPVRVYLPPPGIGEDLARASLEAAFMAGVDITLYMGGSDHDVMLGHGVPAVMVNQWPDPYYHSDWDDAYRIDPDRLRESAVLGAMIILASSGEWRPSAPDPRPWMLVSKHLARGDTVSAGLARQLFLGGGDGSWRPVDDPRIVRSLVPFLADYTLPGMRGEEAAVLARLVSEVRSAFARELFFHTRDGITVSALHSKLAAIYGVDRIRGDVLVRVLEAYERLGLVEFS
ncbi:MAG: DUF4910 domain-containing protein [Desulfurococcales archaeon]|nr:DUF4910 domain-containing protein [Desulfurococcales archaeon]